MSPHQRINKLKRLLGDCEFEAFRIFLLEQAAADDLVAIREQKMLVKIRDASVRHDVIGLYKDAITRLIVSPTERKIAISYATFLELATEAFDELAKVSNRLTSSVCNVGLLDLLAICETTIADVGREISKELHAEFLKPSGTSNSIAATSEAHEAAFQFWGGRLKDFVFATARALNESSRFSLSADHKCTNKDYLRHARDDFQELCMLAGQWNSLEYALDKVSFGEWVVTSLDKEGKPTVTFDESDPLSAKAMRLGNRRSMVHTAFVRKEKRFLRNFLREDSPRAILAAAAHFEEQFPGIEFTQKDYASLKRGFAPMFEFIDADDDRSCPIYE